MPLVVELPCVYVPIAGVYVVGVAFLKDRFTFSWEFGARLEKLFQLCWQYSGELPTIGIAVSWIRIWALDLVSAPVWVCSNEGYWYSCVGSSNASYQLLQKEKKL